MRTKIEGSPHHHLSYVPNGWQRGMAMVSLIYPECEIQIVKTDPTAGTVTSTIKGAREGDTVRGRISAFIDMARKEKAAVMLVCDTEAETAMMVKLMRQATPELRRIDTADFMKSKEFGRGLRKVPVQIVSHDTDPDYRIKYALYCATGNAA